MQWIYTTENHFADEKKGQRTKKGHFMQTCNDVYYIYTPKRGNNYAKKVSTNHKIDLQVKAMSPFIETAVNTHAEGRALTGRCQFIRFQHIHNSYSPFK